METTLELRKAKRSELRVADEKTLLIQDEPVRVNNFESIYKIANFYSKTYKAAKEYNSPQDAITMINEMLQTKSLSEQNASILVRDGEFVGISERDYQITPAQFIQVVEDFAEKNHLEITRAVDGTDLQLHVSLPISMEMVSKDIYQPGMIFTYSHKTVEVAYALNRLVCTNGSIVRTRGTTYSLYAGNVDKIQKVCDYLSNNHLQAFESVKRSLQLDAITPASLSDLMKFKNHFQKVLGKDEAEEVFLVGKALEMYPNMPEKPSAMWYQTAKIPCTCYDLYNIGTALSTHNQKAQGLDTQVFLSQYLHTPKVMAAMCHESPQGEGLWENLFKLRGE